MVSFQTKLSIPGLGENSIYQRKLRTMLLKMVSFSVFGDIHGLICVYSLSLILYSLPFCDVVESLLH